MVLLKNLSRDDNHEGQGQMPMQQLPSIQEMFGETYPLVIPSGPSYARSSDTRHAAPPALPAVYGIEHINQGAPSNEQGLLFKDPTVETSLGIIHPINELQHPGVIHPGNPTPRSIYVSRAFSRRLPGADNASSSSFSSQGTSVSRHQFCHPKMLLSSTSPPNGRSLNEPCHFSRQPDLSIPQPGSMSWGPVDSAQPSFAKPPNMLHEIPIRKISNLTPHESQRLCQPEKQTPCSLGLCLSFNVIETVSAQTLAFVQYHSTMNQSGHHQRPHPGPSITEISGFLRREQQKQDALIHIRDELVRFNQKQASAQQNTWAAVCLADVAGRVPCLSVAEQSKTHKVPTKRNQWHGDGALRCYSCNRSETPEWRRGPDGARTLCNACGLHYAKLSRQKGKFKTSDNDIGIEAKKSRIS